MRNLIAAIALGLWALVPLATSASAATVGFKFFGCGITAACPAGLTSYPITGDGSFSFDTASSPTGLADLTAFNFSVCFFACGTPQFTFGLADLKAFTFDGSTLVFTTDFVSQSGGSGTFVPIEVMPAQGPGPVQLFGFFPSPPPSPAVQSFGFFAITNVSVPEPGIWGFMILSFTVLAFSRRRLLARAAALCA